MWAPYAWFAFSQARSFLYHRRNGYTLEDESLEEITSGLIQTNVLRLDLGVVPCEVVQAEITGLPAVSRRAESMELGHERGKVCDEQ